METVAWEAALLLSSIAACPHVCVGQSDLELDSFPIARIPKTAPTAIPAMPMPPVTSPIVRWVEPPVASGAGAVGVVGGGDDAPAGGGAVTGGGGADALGAGSSSRTGTATCA